MQIGKLTNQELERLVFSRLPKLSDRTQIGGQIGADCAWISLGPNTLIATSDPITAGGKVSGTLAVHVSCNDIAASGVHPIGILMVILVPATAIENDIVTIVDQASAAAKALGVDIVGGHTEITDSVNTSVVTTTAFGTTDPSVPRLLGRVLPGDTLLMTKTAALEGTWIIAHNNADRLKDKVSEETMKDALSMLDQISVVSDGTIAAASATDKDSDVHLMHDATEGGILGAAHEMADYSGIGLKIYPDRIPVTHTTRQICDAVDMDPLRLISSGSMLIATSRPERITEALSRANIQCTDIGTFQTSGFIQIDASGQESPLGPPERDHIYRL